MTISPINAENTFLATATIASGATGLSEAIPAKGLSITGIVMPAAWQAANLGLHGSVDGTNFKLLKDGVGVPLKCTVAADSYVNQPFPDLQFWPYLKLASIDDSGVAVDQTVARSIQFLLRKSFS